MVIKTKMIIDEFNCRNLILFRSFVVLVTIFFWTFTYFIPNPSPIHYFMRYFICTHCERRQWRIYIYYPLRWNPHRMQSWNLGDFIHRIITIQKQFYENGKVIFETMNHDYYIRFVEPEIVVVLLTMVKGKSREPKCERADKYHFVILFRWYPKIYARLNGLRERERARVFNDFDVQFECLTININVISLFRIKSVNCCWLLYCHCYPNMQIGIN